MFLGCEEAGRRDLPPGTCKATISWESPRIWRLENYSHTRQRNWSQKSCGGSNKHQFAVKAALSVHEWIWCSRVKCINQKRREQCPAFVRSSRRAERLPQRIVMCVCADYTKEGESWCASIKQNWVSSSLSTNILIQLVERESELNGQFKIERREVKIEKVPQTKGRISGTNWMGA